MSFSQLRIRSDILKGLKDVKAENPTPLQKQIFNAMKEGGDVLIRSSSDAQPETGFLTAILDQIAQQERRQGTKAIILTEDPERCQTLQEWIRTTGSHAGIEAAVIDRNGDPVTQRHALSAGPSIILGHPERLAGLMEEHRMIFREAAFLILDRIDDVRDKESAHVIRKRMLGQCKVVATVCTEDEKQLDDVRELLQEPKEIRETVRKSVAPPLQDAPQSDVKNGSIPKDLTQYYIKVPPRMKISTLMSQLEEKHAESTLIFTASRRTADRLYRILRKSGKRAVSLHKGIQKKTFAERFDRFTSGNVKHLIAGEMSAQELNLDRAEQVINYDVPEEVEEYKLRAELTGRDNKARIVSLVSKQDRSDIHEIIEQLGYAPEEIPLPKSVLDDSKKRSKGRGNTHQKQTKKQERRSREPVQKAVKKKRPRPGSAPTGPAKGAAGLPRPSYDKLRGGRTGEKKESKGLKGFFKKLFS